MWTLGIGFALAGLGPVLVGALRDLSGGFELPIALLRACVVACGLLGQAVGPGFGREPSLARG